MRDESVALRNYGSLLVDLAKITPDGIICVFSDFANLKLIVTKWQSMGIIDRLFEQKLLFIETANISQKSIETYSLYKEACKLGRGGILLITANGILANIIQESICHSLVFIGIPHKFHMNYLENTRCEYIQKVRKITKSEYQNFETMRIIGSLAGRVFNNKKHDFVACVLGDKKYAVLEKIEFLPKWIQKILQNTAFGEPRIGITEDVGLHFCKNVMLKGKEQKFIEDFEKFDIV